MVACLHCTAELPAVVAACRRSLHVCDTCQEFIRTHGVNPPRLTPGDSTPQPDGRKSKRRSTRKRTAVATALVLMLLPFTGCSVAWSGSVSLDVDPSPLLRLQTLLPPPNTPIPTAESTEP